MEEKKLTAAAPPMVLFHDDEYGERRISGTSQLDGWLSELGLTGQERQDQPEQEETAVQETVPEAIQEEGTEILELENLPTYTYHQQEIELDNQGQRIYGIAFIPDTENLYRLDLVDEDDQKIEIEYEGRVNIVQIENHKVGVLAADCPDHTCINMGWLDSSTPIVCLPNHLVIQFANMSKSRQFLC